MRLAFAEAISDCGFTTLTAQSCSEALEIIKKGPVDAALIDLMMPATGGIETLQEIKKLDPDLPMFIVSGYTDVAAAVEAVKLGAYDYILKPPDFDRLCLTLKRATEQYNLLKENRRLNTALDVSLENIFGRSAAAKEIISQLHLAAKSDFSVVIQGETGTGKTTAAHSIHRLGKRAEGPFVVVDMGAIPETLVESELFGHEKGAFTGADKKKKGFFEIASGGTIVIDELQNMSPYVQGKLLREDLFFRVCEYGINMPPLRERIEDIVPLAERFLAEACAALNMSQGR